MRPTKQKRDALVSTFQYQACLMKQPSLTVGLLLGFATALIASSRLLNRHTSDHYSERRGFAPLRLCGKFLYPLNRIPSKEKICLAQTQRILIP
jgi:hypothetical protein